MLIALLGMELASASVSISIEYTGDMAYKPAFTKAADYWMGQLTGYVTGNGPATIVISASDHLDGPGNAPASGEVSAAYYYYRPDNLEYYALTEEGRIRFDTEDFIAGSTLFEKTVLHEMAHVLGFGTLWEYNFLYDATVAPVTDPRTLELVQPYVGQYALAAWKGEFGSPTDTYVPLEKAGGPGVADMHWNERDGSNAIMPTGYVSRISGLDLSKELMTAVLDNSGPNGFSDVYVSSVTLASFRDSGYTIIPEPGSVLALAMAAALSLARRRR